MEPVMEGITLQKLKTSFEITVEDAKKFKLEKKDPISIFIQSIVKLKTDVNVKFGYKEDGKTPIGKISPYAFFLIAALAIFMKRFDEDRQNDGLTKHVHNMLARKADELYYVGLTDSFVSKEQGDQLIDALSVKFYQTVLLGCVEYFAINEQMLVMEPTKDGYRFRYRPVNIMERNQMQQGKLPINAKY